MYLHVYTFLRDDTVDRHIATDCLGLDGGGGGGLKEYFKQLLGGRLCMYAHSMISIFFFGGGGRSVHRKNTVKKYV
jgi:hypothetical protein